MKSRNIWVLGITLILLASVTGLADALVLRQQQTLRDENASLTLYPTGRAVFYYNNQTFEGKWDYVTGIGPSGSSGVVNLYETDGTKVYSFPFMWASVNQTILWVDIGGTKLRR